MSFFPAHAATCGGSLTREMVSLVLHRRWKEFYMGSKVVTTLFLLHACQYPPDTIIVFSDSDVLIQGRAAHRFCLWI